MDEKAPYLLPYRDNQHAIDNICNCAYFVHSEYNSRIFNIGIAMNSSSHWWLMTIGFLGQSLFFMRFFLQWIVSEKEKRSVIPVSFWYFSLLGSFFLLVYALLRNDIVFIIGQSTGFIIYFRNLFLIQRERRLVSGNSQP